MGAVVTMNRLMMIPLAFTLLAAPVSADHELGCLVGQTGDDVYVCHRHQATDDDYELSQCDEYGNHWESQRVSFAVNDDSGTVNLWGTAWDTSSCTKTTSYECDVDYAGATVRQGGYPAPTGYSIARVTVAEHDCFGGNVCQADIWFDERNTGFSESWRPVNSACPKL